MQWRGSDCQVKRIIVSFKILGVYPGNKYDDVSISQLIFNSEYGADFDE